MSKDEATTRSTLLSLELSGLEEFEPRRLEALVETLHRAVTHPYTPPKGLCHGARLVVRRVAWECLKGRWTLFQTDTYVCPSGALQDVRKMILQTDDPCEQLLG